MSSNRNKALDGLRGIAVVFVILYHYTIRFEELYYPMYQINVFKYGGEIGVGIFFILSGYLMIMVGKKDNPYSFVIKRIFRLYPAYIISVLLTSITLYFYGIENLKPNFLQVIINMTMLHEFVGVSPVDGVYWTLTLEILLYTFIFILIVYNYIKYVNALLLLWLLLQFGIYIFIPNPLPSKILTVFFYSSYFLIGMAIYTFFKENSKFLSVFILVLTLLEMHYIYHKSLFLPMVFIAIFSIVSIKNIPFLSHKTLVFIGTISYPLYLTHQYIGYVLLDYFYKYAGNKIIAYSITIGIIFLLSYFISKFIEYPMINIGHKVAKKIQRKQM